jgi:hypothetical protein
VRYKTIENLSDLNDVFKNLSICLILIIPETFKNHPVNYKISLIFLKDVESDIIYVIPINHTDYVSEIKIIDVLEKLKEIELISLDSKKDYHAIGFYPSLDINILSYLSTLEILDISTTFSNKHSNFYLNEFKNLNCPNCFVPSSYFMELFETVYEFSNSVLQDHSSEITTDAYRETFQLNKILGNIESSGIYIDIDQFHQSFDSKFHSNINNNLVYSEYSMFTSTGRPSNKFGGINFAALSKKDDTRKCFISRFGSNGILFDIDFQACHPHLIAKLIGYNIPKDLNNPIYFLLFYLFYF